MDIMLFGPFLGLVKNPSDMLRIISIKLLLRIMLWPLKGGCPLNTMLWKPWGVGDRAKGERCLGREQLKCAFKAWSELWKDHPGLPFEAWANGYWLGSWLFLSFPSFRSLFLFLFLFLSFSFSFPFCFFAKTAYLQFHHQQWESQLMDLDFPLRLFQPMNGWCFWF